MITSVLVLMLVFVAVAWCSWVITPIITQIGLERSEGRYVKTGNTQLTAMYRFTTPARLLQASWSFAIMGGGLTAAGLLFFNVLNTGLLVGVSLFAGLLAFQLPGWWLNYRIQQRRMRFEAKLVDFTLGLANGLRSGAALPQTIELVARDIGGPITEEFTLLLHEVRLGMDFPEALKRLCIRMPSEDLHLLATAIHITMTSGGSLAEVLDRITDTIRERTEFQQRLRTMTAQGRFEASAMASAPVAAFLILLYLDRELMLPLISTTFGWCALGIVAVLEVIGFFIINRIVTVEG